MFFVKSTSEGVWRSARDVKPGPDADGNMVRERYFVRALVEALWCIDGRKQEVEPGLVVSFGRSDDAEYFLTCHGRKEAPRCELVFVGPGSLVVFASQDDAQLVIEAGKAEPMTEEQVYAEMQAAQAGESDVHTANEPFSEMPAEEGSEDMLKAKLENKAVASAKDTKGSKPAAPPKMKGGKKGK